MIDNLELFNAFNFSAPAAWIQVLSVGVCFKSAASFCHPQRLLKTSSLCIHSAWNSWIRHSYLNSTLLSRRNIWNLVLATLRPESRKLTWTILRFLARTLRPVASDIVQAKSSGENRRTTGGFVFNLPRPRVNKTKQHLQTQCCGRRDSTNPSFFTW